MARLLRMPEVAANATEAVLQDWALTENQPFSAEDTVATVETEKAVVDVEADAAGVLLRTLVAAGSQVAVGSPIALIAEPGETVDDVDGLLAELGVESAPVVVPERRSVPDDPEGGTANTGESEVARELPAPQQPQDSDPDSGSDAGRNGRIFASPLARRLAAEGGLALGDIEGTGPRGRILKRDVQGTVTRNTQDSQIPPGSRETPEYTEVPHSRMRRAIASRLTESKQETPHFYLRGTARVDRLLRLREELNSGAGVKISVNDLVIKAVARAHVEVPAMNVVWQAEALRAFSAVDISVAVATETGLLTPVLRDVDAMTVSTVASHLRDLAERARAGRLKQQELEGGSVSVTNLGMYGTEEFAAIINPPQAAILAVGAARREPVVKKSGKLASGTVMRVTLSVDHRAVDGAVAAEWMRKLLTLLDRPVQLLA
jgi:pyruvate dehydrogenase E2 component (dihydrolipoamide acetyltransferase)